MGGFLIGKLVRMATTSYVDISDYRYLIRELNKVEPTLAAGMRKEIRTVMKPLQQSVAKNIPMERPRSGMVTRIGRLSWGAGKPAKTVLIDTRAPRVNKDSLTGSFAKLRVTSPATVMADMMGRSGRYIGARRLATGSKSAAIEVTRGKYKGQMGYPYFYKGASSPEGRIHRNTGGQGRGLIRGLGAKPSRYVWPAALKGLPATRVAITQIFDKNILIINQKLRSR
jgi:hypothetical protein